MIIFICLLIIFNISLLWENSVLHFKVGYYEQKLINHRSKFSNEAFKLIENVMKKKSPFKFKL